MQAYVFLKVEHDLEYFAYMWFINPKFELEQIQKKKIERQSNNWKNYAI